MKMAHAPPGHHSVIGRPSVNGLAYAEYVIYRGEQVCSSSDELTVLKNDNTVYLDQVRVKERHLVKHLPHSLLALIASNHE